MTIHTHNSTEHVRLTKQTVNGSQFTLAFCLACSISVMSDGICQTIAARATAGVKPANLPHQARPCSLQHQRNSSHSFNGTYCKLTKGKKCTSLYIQVPAFRLALCGAWVRQRAHTFLLHLAHRSLFCGNAAFERPSELKSVVQCIPASLL